MNILLVNTRHYPGGGDSTYTFNLAELLRSQGHAVAFFAMQDERNVPDPDSDLFVSHIDFRELNGHKNLAAGAQVLTRSIYSVEARLKFAQMLDRFMADVVHLQGIHAHITPSVIFEAQKYGIPVVWALHEYKLICPNSHFLNDTTGEICESCGVHAYYQAILNRCKKGSLLASSIAAVEAYAHRLLRVRERVDAFLPSSAFLRNKLIERGFPRAKVHHMPLFVPERMFQNSAADQGYLLFLGKLDPIKGIRVLLEACRLAPEIRLILAGRAEEPFASELPALLPSNAEYVGMKHGKELEQLLRNARAIVLPSLTYENQPLSILEAFAYGKPVIASDLGGMIELVVHRERGLTVRPKDAERLASAMRWMTSHPSEAQEMGRNARAYACVQHHPEQHYERLMGVYKQVLRGGRR